MYSCAAGDKISTDLRARAVSLRQLSYLLNFAVCHNDAARRAGLSATADPCVYLVPCVGCGRLNWLSAALERTLTLRFISYRIEQMWFDV